VFNPHWKQSYERKLTTARAAIEQIAPGRRILIGSGAAEPATLVEALVRHGNHLADNEIVHLLTLGPAPYVAPDMAARFRHTAFFIGPNVREAVQAGRADFMPVFLSEIPSLIRSRRVKVDVALLQVSPPDLHGYVSLGVSVDIVRAAVEAADLVIAEVNPRMPRTLGNTFVSVADIHRLVSVEAPLFELVPEAPDAVSDEIARHVATLVPDGATLQTGIGKIPHAVLKALSGRRDLGIHTEMLSDSVIDLVESGAINGRRKTLLPGKLVTSFVMGSKRLYDWVNDNPAVELHPSDFTNDPLTIAKNFKMVAINSALAVDLTGQVASDTLGGRFFSGIGGQVDFIRGAALSHGGRPIIALPSTAKRGTLSRICGALEAGAGVVTSRGDVHYVVTEFGIAHLWGRSVRERAAALIDIAHPDFRAELLSDAKARRYVFEDQPIPNPSPVQQDRVVTLVSGERVRIRAVRVSDEEGLQDLLYRLSDESTFLRFFGFKAVHPRVEMLSMVKVDAKRSAALVGCLEDGDSGELIGSARYDLDPTTGLGEVAFSVADAWQGKGLGTALFGELAQAARVRDIPGFSADVLPGNGRMLRLLHRPGYQVKTQLAFGVEHLQVLFNP